MYSCFSHTFTFMLIFPVENYVRRENLNYFKDKIKIISINVCMEMILSSSSPPTVSFPSSQCSLSFLSHYPTQSILSWFYIVNTFTYYNNNKHPPHPILFHLLCVHRKLPAKAWEKFFLLTFSSLTQFYGKSTNISFGFIPRPSQSCGGNSNENA